MDDISVTITVYKYNCVRVCVRVYDELSCISYNSYHGIRVMPFSLFRSSHPFIVSTSMFTCTGTSNIVCSHTDPRILQRRKGKSSVVRIDRYTESVPTTHTHVRINVPTRNTYTLHSTSVKNLKISKITVAPSILKMSKNFIGQTFI